MIKKNLSWREFIKKSTNFSIAGLFLSHTSSAKNLTLMNSVPTVSDIKSQNGKLDPKTFSDHLDWGAML